ncbi:MAG: peroxide stress protein YaaA [Mariniblastus sp.]
MLHVLSPAKTLDYETPLPVAKTSQPLFKKQSAELIDVLRGYTPQKISKLMGISDKLAHLNADRYEAWEEKPTTKNARAALFAFKGDVYVGLDAYTFTESDCEFAQDRLRILSGLYGVLRPLDLLQAYRLEMGTKLETDKGTDLYQFWGGEVTDALNKQLKKNNDDVLVNLASNEYFKVVQTGRLNARIISPVFKDQKNDKYKIISFFAKKARGVMSGWMMRNRVTDPKKLVEFAETGYKYSAKESTENEPVFLRKENWK